jgi:hypothetical protein
LRYWDTQHGIGRKLANAASADEVIGVLGDVRHIGLDAEPVAEVYRWSDSGIRMTYVLTP